MHKYQVLGKVLENLSRIRNLEEFDYGNLIEAFIESRDEEDNEIFCAAYYLTFDPFKRKFKCPGVYPRNQFNDVLELLKDHIRKYPLKSNNLEDYKGLGVIYYIALECLKGNFDNTYIAANNLEELKINPPNYFEYYTDIDEKIVEPKSVYWLPIFITSQDPFNIKQSVKFLRAVIVLFSKNDHLSLTSEFLKKISELFSNILTFKSIKSSDTLIHNFLIKLSQTKSDHHFRDIVEETFEALNGLYHSHTSQNSFLTKLKYSSFWSVNYTSKSLFLIKEGITKYQHSNSNYASLFLINRETLDNNKYHIYFEHITKLLNNKQNKHIYFNKLGNVKAKFKNYNGFLSEVKGLSNNDILVLVPITPSNFIFEYGKTKHFIGLIALIFHNDSFSYLFSQKIIEIISLKIYEKIKVHIQTKRRELRTELYSLVDQITNDSNEFYSSISQKIRDEIECQDCLIYILNDKEEYELSTFDKELKYPRNFSLNNTRKFLEKFEKFSNYLQEYFSGSEFSEKYCYDIHSIGEPSTPNEISSLLILPVSAASNHKPEGFIVLINNFCKVDNVETFSSFCFEDHEVAVLAAQTILFYIRISDNFNAKVKLFSRLKHEIPGQASKIHHNALFLKKKLNDIYTITIYKQVPNIINQIILPSVIISGYTDFIIMEEKEKKKELNMISIKLVPWINSIAEWMNTESLDFGVNFNFEILASLNGQSIIVEELFPLVLINLIRNAIHYAYPGTSIFLSCNKDSDFYTFRVSDIGIPLHKTQRIYSEGYRHPEAVAKYVSGTGYGLYVAKKVLNWHKNSHLEFDESEINFYSRNIFAINTISELFLRHPDFANNLYNHLNEPNQERIKFYNDYFKLTKFEKQILVNDKYAENLYFTGIDNFYSFLQFQLNRGENIETFLTKYLNRKISQTVFKIKVPIN